MVMVAEDFQALAARITAQLGGKTISYATSRDWGMGYSVTLYFTDGSSAEIHPEHDEGFDFDITASPPQQGGGAGHAEVDVITSGADGSTIRVTY